MSWVVTAIVASTAVTGYAQYRSAEAQEIELERQAEEEKLAAQSRELQRRQRLNKALAANVVGQATSGITGEGTPSSIAMESAKQVSISEGVESLTDRLRQAQLKRQAKNASTAGKLAAGSTLLKGASQTAQLSGGE